MIVGDMGASVPPELLLVLELAAGNREASQHQHTFSSEQLVGEVPSIGRERGAGAWITLPYCGTAVTAACMLGTVSTAYGACG